MTFEWQHTLLGNLLEANGIFLDGIGRIIETSSLLEFKEFYELAREAQESYTKIMQGYMQNPFAAYQTVMNNFQHLSGYDVEFSVKPEKPFKEEDWYNHPFFITLRLFYEIWQKLIEQSAADLLKYAPSNVIAKQIKRINFFIKQYVDALSPTNVPWLNPAVISKTIETSGENLIKGAKNFVRDVNNSHKGYFMVQNTDKSAFKIGKDLATTKGKVVFRNDLIELIQYTPVKPKVFSIPLLIVTAWINKFYILDLSPENSLVKWLIEQGFNVFIISWHNPNEKDRDLTFDDYIQQGILTAIDQIIKITGAKKVNCMGNCLGGTTLAMTLAYLQKKRPDVVNSASLSASLIDFSDAGVIGDFIDEKAIEYIERIMQEKGVLDDQFMYISFQLLRANDLLWPYVISNYWLGEAPKPFDMLFWNADSTRLPARMHSYYLRNMYLENNLIKPNTLSVLGEPIDVGSIDIPVYIMAIKSDHIVPWYSVYNYLYLFKGKKRFVLSTAGHVAAIVNPPRNNKYYYFVPKDDNYKQTAESWLKNAVRREHSWWEDWSKWLVEYSGPIVDSAKVIAKRAIADAPGKYIME